MTVEAIAPDVVDQFVTWAKSRPAITDITGPKGISIKLPAGAGGVIRVALVSGGDEVPGGGGPLLQVECWGKPGADDDGTASLLGRTLKAEIPTFVGDFAGGRVAGASATNPFASPDPLTSRPRYIVQVRVMSHALS